MRNLSPAARSYLLFAGLLTFGAAVSGLFFNLLLVELGYDQRTVTLPLVGPVALLGLLNSAPVLAGGLSSLPAWWLVSRAGPRAGLIAGALLAAASLLGTALWSDPLPLMAAIALAGPASVLVQVSAAPFMMRHSGERERDSLFALSAGLGIAVSGVGALIGGLIPGLVVVALGLEAQGAAAYRVTFAIAAALAALAALPLIVGRDRRARFVAMPAGGSDAATEPEGPEAGPMLVPAPFAEQLRLALRAALASLRFLVAPLLIGLGAALLIPYLNLYFRQRFDATDAALGVIFAAIGIATGAATLVAPVLSRHLGKPASVVLTQTLAIPCLLLLGLAPALWVAALVALARGALMNMAAPLYDAYAMEQTPAADRPVVIGLVRGAFAAGAIVGPTVSAEVQRRYGFGPLFVATACLYAAAALAGYLLFVRPRGARSRV